MRSKEASFVTSSPRGRSSTTSPSTKVDNVTEFRANGSNLFTMLTKLENDPKKNYETKNIFTILRKKDENNKKALANSLLPNTIKIYIKNENNISNYFSKDGHKEPVIMSQSKYTSKFKECNSKIPTMSPSGSSKCATPRSNTFSEKYSKSSKTGNTISSSIPRASSPRPTLGRKETFHDLKTKYNGGNNKLPTYFTPQTFVNPRKSTEHHTTPVVIKHRRKLDSTDDYTSYETMIDEMTQITDEEEHVRQNRKLSKHNSDPGGHVITTTTSSSPMPAAASSLTRPKSSSIPVNSKLVHLRNLYNGPTMITSSTTGKKVDSSSSSVPTRRPKISPHLLQNKIEQTIDIKAREPTSTPRPSSQTGHLTNTSRLVTPRPSSRLTMIEHREHHESSNRPNSGLPRLQQTNNRNAGLKQDSSNFSLIRGMNSNELGNYIDNVISNFRMTANLYESVPESRELRTANAFYPENEEYNYIEQVAAESYRERQFTENHAKATTPTYTTPSALISYQKSRMSSSNEKKSTTPTSGVIRPPSSIPKYSGEKVSNKKKSTVHSQVAKAVPVQVVAHLPPQPPPNNTRASVNLQRSKPIDPRNPQYAAYFQNLVKSRPTNNEEIVLDEQEEAVEPNNEENMMVESRTLTSASSPRAHEDLLNRDKDDDEDSATFINYTHSIEINDSQLDFDDVEIGAGFLNEFEDEEDDYEEEEIEGEEETMSPEEEQEVADLERVRNEMRNLQDSNTSYDQQQYNDNSEI